MKRFFKRFMAVGTTVLMTAGLTVNAVASTITVSYSDMKVTLNDRRLLLQDGNGDSVEPFIYDGTTYLPFRAIAQSLGLTVGWDGTTNTITLTGTPTASVPEVSSGGYPYGGFGESSEEITPPDRDMDTPRERVTTPEEPVRERPDETMPDRGDMGDRPDGMRDRGGMGERPDGMPDRGGMGERPDGMMFDRGEMGERPEGMRGNMGERHDGAMFDRGGFGERPEGMTPPNDEIRERPEERPLHEENTEERPIESPPPNPEVRESLDFNAISNATTQFPPGTIGDKDIEAAYSGITVVINGTPITLKDGNGKSIEPFISNGTTYLPLRAISQALGLQVDWDGATSTVKLAM